MPAITDANIGARVVFAGINKRVVDKFSNYKKFKTDTKIVGYEEVKPQK